MSDFVPFNTPSGVVWIEIEDSTNGPTLINAFQSTAFDSFEDAAAALTSNAQFIHDMLADLQPNGIEISFGIKAGLNTGSVGIDDQRVFGLAESPDMANYWVKVKWEEEKNAG